MRLAPLVLVVLLAVPIYSYASTMLQPSSLPLTVRTIEWVRDHHGAGLANTVEHYYYSWTAPKKGGPPLKALPVPAQGLVVSRPRHAYLPPPIAPVVKPPLKGEGLWRTTGAAVNGGPPVLITVFRPDPNYPRVVAYVAWIDATRTQLALYPGRYEPPSGSPRGPMRVPQGERHRLLATFNSGFKYADGGGGFYVNRHTYEPLVRGKATLVAYTDGTVDIVSWKGGPAGPTVVLARQNLPLIVNGGKRNPTLNASQSWGSTLGNAVRVWRTAVGVDRHGNLLYLAAPAQTAPSLAAAIIHAGAVRAMELDINAEWPSFITYRGGHPRKIVPNSMQSATRYLAPDDRDFFAVYQRVPGASFAVPFK
jgi:hypothetical protein